MLVQPPTLRYVSFDAQSTDFALYRLQTSYQFDDSFSWFMPGKRGDHDLKFGLQYVWADHGQVVQHRLNGVFTFPSDRAYNATDPRPTRNGCDSRARLRKLPYVFTHSIGALRAGQVADDEQSHLEPWRPLRCRHRADRRAVESALLGSERLSGRLEQHPAAPGPRIQRRPELCHPRRLRDVLREALDRSVRAFVRQGVFASSFVTDFPVDQADPGPSRGQLPTDPMLQNGPVLNRDRLARSIPPGTLARNNSEVFLDTPDRTIPYSHQVSLGYERQLGAQLSFAADYVHSWGRDQVLAYDLNPAVRVDTSRTGPLVRFDLLGLADELGLSPFRKPGVDS